MEDYKIVHIGNGNFKAIMMDGEILEVGNSLCGIIRYTFFENYELPVIGWNIMRNELMEAYQPKVLKDILEGKIKKNLVN
jgi:hypothetical protein